MERLKIAFLYSEVATYFLACAKEAAKEADILIVRWPVNKEAPFVFEDLDALTIVEKTDMSESQLSQLLIDFNPDILVCSGWMDKLYLKVAKKFKKKIPVVIALDNHWNGSLKQRLATLLSPFFLKPIFTHAWVPGEIQKKYAERLGFKGKVILNFYCADTIRFNDIFNRTIAAKREKLPKRFLYVGRYVEHKGIFEMWEAFRELQQENPNDWEMWCLGTGDEWENRILDDKIKHVGFVQPSEMENYIKDSAVYILPSKFEPWGVTVQEFALSGMPILVSSAVGSKEKYVKSNGLEFAPGNKQSIKKAMKQIMTMEEKDLVEMGVKSNEVGMSFTTDMWIKNLITVLN